MNENHKETAPIIPYGTIFSSLLGMLKLPLLFAPFVFMHGCTLSGPTPTFLVPLFFFEHHAWLLILVPLAALVAIALLLIRRRVANFRQRAKLGLLMSLLSVFSVVWTGHVVTCPYTYCGELMWGFWALLACDVGMIGGYSLTILFPSYFPNLGSD